MSFLLWEKSNASQRTKNPGQNPSCRLGALNRRIAGQGGGERSRWLSERAVCLRLIKLWLSSSASEPSAAGTGAGREAGYSPLIQSRGRGDGAGGRGEELWLSIQRDRGFSSLPGRLCPAAAHGAPSCGS